MVELILFIFATTVALVLYDHFVTSQQIQNHSHRGYSGGDIETETRAERNYAGGSLFAVLGFTKEEVRSFTSFRDHFKSYGEVIGAMKNAGLERTRLLVGIDFSASNEWQGRNTFKGDLLHALKGHAIFNPYQKVLHALAPAFAPFLHNQPVHAYGFGDIRTKDYDVFALKPGTACSDMADVLDAYNHNAQRGIISGIFSLSPYPKRL